MCLTIKCPSSPLVTPRKKACPPCEVGPSRHPPVPGTAATTSEAEMLAGMEVAKVDQGRRVYPGTDYKRLMTLSERLHFRAACKMPIAVQMKYSMGMWRK